MTLGTFLQVPEASNICRLVRLRRTGLLDLPPEMMIDGVVLGMSTPAEVETEIRGWVPPTGRRIGGSAYY